MVYVGEINAGSLMAISIIKAAEIWGVKEETVRKWVKNKKLIKKIGLKFDILEGGKYQPIYFQADEIKRVKKLLKPRKEWTTGQSLFRL